MGEERDRWVSVGPSQPGSPIQDGYRWDNLSQSPVFPPY
jgi:hypothetical protein